MPRWNLTISEETDRSVRNYLAQTGDETRDLSGFVDEAVCQKIFRQTVKELKTHNKNSNQQELINLIEEAVSHFRENRP